MKLASESDWDWRLKTRTVFDLQIGFCNLLETQIKRGDVFTDGSNSF